jgi:hypothetical protein
MEAWAAYCEPKRSAEMFLAESASMPARRYREILTGIDMTTPTLSEPLVVKPARACAMLSCGRTRLYELLAAKELDSFLDGGARKVTVASIHRYIERQLGASS